MPDKALATSPRIRELTQRLEKDPGSRAFLDLAKAHQAAGDPGAAARICREGLSKHPRYHSARVLLGKLLLERQEFGGAIEELGKVVAEAPDNLLARRLLGEAQSGDGHQQQALETYRNLLRLQPGDAELVTRIGALEGGPEPPQSLSAVLTAQPVAQPPEEPAKSSHGIETLDMRPDPGVAEEVTPPPVEEVKIERSPPAPEAVVGAQTGAEEIPPTAAMDAPFPETRAWAEPPMSSPATARTVALDPSAVDLSDSEDRPTQILDLGDMTSEMTEDSSDGEARTVMLEVPDLDEPAAPAPIVQGLAAEALPTPTLADLYLEQGLPAEAEKVYLKLLDGDPGNHEIREKLERLRGASAPPGGSSTIRIRALEVWLAKIRRGRDAPGRA